MHKVKYIPFPPEIRGIFRGMVTGNGDIVIDSTRDAATQDHTLRHELAHLVLSHHDAGAPLQEIEREADAMAARYSVKQLETMLKEG